MDEITDLLSQKRLDKYKGVSKEDAVKCHLYNCELAEAFYSSLYYFEIILRNKIDLVFSKSYLTILIKSILISIILS